MSTTEPNLLPPESASPTDAPTNFGWHLIPAAGSFLVGLASTLLGLFLTAAMIYVIIKDGMHDAILGRFVSCILYLGFGSAWIIAGWFYWRGRYSQAMMANGVGLLLWVIVLIAIEIV